MYYNKQEKFRISLVTCKSYFILVKNFMNVFHRRNKRSDLIYARSELNKN